MDGSLMLAGLRLLVSLGVVLTLLVLLARWARRRGVGGTVGARTGVEIELLSRRALSRGSAVHVVRVGEQVLVLGVTDQQVAVLRELEAPAPVAPTLAVVTSASDDADDDRPAPPPERDFATVLAARSAEAEAETETAPLTLVPMTRAERRAIERNHPSRLRLPSVPTGGQPHGPHAHGPHTPGTHAAAPTGWPWNAASLVVGTLKGGRA
ncbi:flagellar biosynthetic protein FliO [Phycicoccus avicenniae]|uniref:flagellar biosynthetic protein FliO n=1 Tax=Phycicoccus avicenniae TaxID=2828860 RepID=UPI003D29846E